MDYIVWSIYYPKPDRLPKGVFEELLEYPAKAKAGQENIANNSKHE